MRLHLRFVLHSVIVLLVVTICLVVINERGRVMETGVNSLSKDIHGVTNQTVTQGELPDLPINSSTEVKLIILTYMRSGSSFTGDLFNQHVQVFYVYEPLWSLQKHYLTNQPVFFFHSKPVNTKLQDFYSQDSLSVPIIKGFLDCRFRSIDPRTLTQNHLLNSESTRRFFYCSVEHPGISGTLACLPTVEKTCRKAKVTAVKTIRFFLKQAETLIKDDPKVKVIHLVRDPRGTLRSQASVAEFAWRDVSNKSKLFCERVYRDLQESERIKTLYPGRLLTARYEDLAMEPLTFAEKLLNFAGLNFDPTLRNYVWRMTSAGLKDGGAISTQRNNSRDTAMSWRRKVTFGEASAIDRHCQAVYRRAGYLTFPDGQSLTNLSLPSFLPHHHIPGLWT